MPLTLTGTTVRGKEENKSVISSRRKPKGRRNEKEKSYSIENKIKKKRVGELVNEQRCGVKEKKAKKYASYNRIKNNITN